MKQMILKIADLLKLRKPRPTPFGLSAEERADLLELASRPGWSVFHNLLDQQAIFSAEKLLHTQDEAQIHFLRGYILGLRRAGMLVREVKVLQETQDERQQRSAERANSEPRRRSAYGTPFWT